MRRLCLLASLSLLACDPGQGKPPAPQPTVAPKPTSTPTPPATPPIARPPVVQPPATPGSGAPLTALAPDSQRSDLKSDEEARIFPAIARRDGDAWELRVHAWVYEPEEDSVGRAATVEALRVALGLPDEAAESAIFRARARPFLVDNESSKALVVRIGDARYLLNSTGFNGHSETDLRVAASGLRPDAAGWVPIDVVTREHDLRHFGGAALLLADSGTSVISDLDDTIKISEVRDKAKLLKNTFMREPVAVPGMADFYRRWAGAGATFHYVSASPWQLFDVLGTFFKSADFPAGSVHMKQFRWKDSSFFSLFEDPRGYKLPILRDLLRRSPGRRFVLVGDSGELDPEAYGELARELPAQVAAIHIRDVTGEGRDAPRYAAAFADLPAERWTLFTDPTTLPQTLP